MIISRGAPVQEMTVPETAPPQTAPAETVPVQIPETPPAGPGSDTAQPPQQPAGPASEIIQ